MSKLMAISGITSAQLCTRRVFEDIIAQISDISVMNAALICCNAQRSQVPNRAPRLLGSYTPCRKADVFQLTHAHQTSQLRQLRNLLHVLGMYLPPEWQLLLLVFPLLIQLLLQLE